MPVRVGVAPSGTVAARVHQDLFIVRNDEKSRLLGKLLSEYRGTVLVFCRTKHGAKRLCRSLRAYGHAVAEIHSNLSMSQRRRALDGFKSGVHRVLVATDIAARGIDVQNIEVVINYDFPDNPHDYVHRVGRTGRAGQPGQAVTFITPEQRGKIRSIERLVRTPLRISPLPALPPQPAETPHHTHETQHRRAGHLPRVAPTGAKWGGHQQHGSGGRRPHRGRHGREYRG
jgi:ATP-dependent RNA helicase RhlE